MSDRCEFLLRNGRRCKNKKKWTKDRWYFEGLSKLCPMHTKREDERLALQKKIAEIKDKQSQIEVFRELFARSKGDELLTDAIKLLADMLKVPPQRLPPLLAEYIAEYRRKYGEEP